MLERIYIHTQCTHEVGCGHRHMLDVYVGVYKCIFIMF